MIKIFIRIRHTNTVRACRIYNSVNIFKAAASASCVRRHIFCRITISTESLHRLSILQPTGRAILLIRTCAGTAGIMTALTNFQTICLTRVGICKTSTICQTLIFIIIKCGYTDIAESKRLAGNTIRVTGLTFLIHAIVKITGFAGTF